MQLVWVTFELVFLWCLKLWNAECTTRWACLETYQPENLIIASGWLQIFMYCLFMEIFFFFFLSYLFKVLWWYVLLKTSWQCYRKAALCCLRLSCDPHAAAQQASWQKQVGHEFVTVLVCAVVISCFIFRFHPFVSCFVFHFLPLSFPRLFSSLPLVSFVN